MKRVLTLTALLISLLAALAACGADSGPTPGPGRGTARHLLSPTLRPFPLSSQPPATLRPIPTGIHSFDGVTPLPQLPADTAVYLSLGDSLQYGCCWEPQLSSHPLFADYLSRRLGRPVVWVSLAGNDTLVEFIDGVAGQRPQLDSAVDFLEQMRREGTDIVAITLSIGGNDLLAVREICGGRGGSDPACLQAFQDMLLRYPQQMDQVYQRLNSAKDSRTPVLQNNYYDAMDCGRPRDDISASAVGVQVFNGYIEGVVTRHGAFLRDFHTAFDGKACEYISGVDPTYAGYDAIFDVDRALYDALPPEYVEPFVRR